MFYFGALFVQLQPKVKFLQKLGCHLLDVKIMYFHLKKSEENYSTILMKNVELTERRSEIQPDKGYFIGPSVYGYSIYKEKLSILYLLSIFLLYNFELIWPGLPIPDQGQLTCDSFTKSYLLPLLILEILEFQESSTT